MTFVGATIGRKQTREAADKALAKVSELVTSHNEIILEVARVRNGLATVEGQLTKRLDAQRTMIEAAEKATSDHRTHVINLSKEQRDYVDAQDKSLTRRLHAERGITDAQIAFLFRQQERFEQMGFFARLRWLLTGALPQIGPGMVPEETSGPVVIPHETPRPIHPVRSREEAEAQLAGVKDELAAALATNDDAGAELETFIRVHGVSPLRFGVEPTGAVRISRLDQTAAVAGRVRGNRFIPD